MLALFDTTDEWKEAVDAWQGIPDRPPKAYRSRHRGFKVLKNNFMERFIGTSHWAMPGLWFVPVIALCLWDALGRRGLPGWQVGLVFGGGVLGWTLVEYILHRWVFHLAPLGPPLLKEIQYVMHGYHHDFPDDPGRLVAPPALSWPIATVLVLLYSLAFGAWWTTLFAGTVAGYLAYDWMHYYTHHAKPKTKVGKFLRRFHYEHHFGMANSQFGLSSPLWDLLLGTFWTTKAVGGARAPAAYQEEQDT